MYLLDGVNSVGCGRTFMVAGSPDSFFAGCIQCQAKEWKCPFQTNSLWDGDRAGVLTFTGLLPPTSSASAPTDAPAASMTDLGQRPKISQPYLLS